MRTRRRSAAVVGAVLALAATLTTVSAEASRATAHHRSDAATVGGYDFHTLLDADVVAGESGNLVIRYTAGRAVRNGVLRIALPRRSWPTDLRPESVLYETTPPGAFSVRPGAAGPEGTLPEPTRTSAQSCDPVPAGGWDVADLPGAQVLTVRGITCAAGRELTLRLVGIRAPARPGTYALPLLLTASGSLPRVSVAAVRVVPQPRIRLVVTVPAHAEPAVPFDVIVFAIGPDGLPARGYRGAIAITDPDDCTLNPRGRQVVHRFTAADQGTTTLQVQLDLSGTHHLRVYDVARRAVDGVSAPFDVSGPPPDSVICPVSYH